MSIIYCISTTSLKDLHELVANGYTVRLIPAEDWDRWCKEEA